MRSVMPLKMAPTYVINHMTTATWEQIQKLKWEHMDFLIHMIRVERSMIT